jgi:hypothetical protein
LILSLNGSNDGKVYAFGSPNQIAPPQISLLLPTNLTYNESSIPLVFTLDELVNWAGYSLDGKQNVTITANSTLTNSMLTNVTIANVTNGLHIITVYANDTFGNTGSETANFTVALPPLKHSEPFPTATVAAVSAISAVLVVAGFLVYLKKRKR